MALSLDVLPRMVDPGQDLSVTHITRTALYDQFIELWLERGKKRLVEKKLSSPAKAVFESLVDEGFTRNGIDYLKKLSVAIYREQGGQPIVTYSRYKDEDSWKASFFSREDEKQLLREACPLVRNENQHRFIHRSLLEYGMALAIFDPKEAKEAMIPELSSTRRMSDIATGDCIHDLGGHLGRVRSVTYSPQEDQIASASSDKTVMVWDVQTGRCCNTLSGHTDSVEGVIYSPQGNQIASRSTDCTVRLWDAETKKRLHFLRSHLKSVSSIAYSLQGDQVASASFDETIRLWSVATGDCHHILTGHTGRIYSLAYSPNGDQIACSGDESVRLWDVKSEVYFHTLLGHEDTVNRVVYSPQGGLIASSSNDKTVRLWDVETGVCRQTLTGHSSWIYSSWGQFLAFSPKGDLVASGSYDGIAPKHLDTFQMVILKS